MTAGCRLISCYSCHPDRVTMRPYKHTISDSELDSFGGDLEQAIESQWKDAAALASSYEWPRAGSFSWNAKSRYWGQVWAEAKEVESRHCKIGLRGPYMVIAGIGGSMVGIPVTHGLPQQAARDFCSDFASGRIFITSAIGAELWLEMIDDAQTVKRFSTQEVSFLRNFSRDCGIIGRRKITRGFLEDFYRHGATISDLIDFPEYVVRAGRNRSKSRGPTP